MEKSEAQVNADILKILGALGIETKANESMSSAQAGFGDEFVPTEMAKNVIEAARAESTVLSQIPAANIWDMPSPTFNLPVQGADPTFYLTGENTNVTGTAVTTSKAGTAQAQLVAKKISASVYISGELDDDAAIAGGIQAQVEKQLGEAYAEQVDDMIVNGDTETGATGNVNKDDGAVAAGTRTLAWDGLRKQAFTDSLTKDVGALSSSDFIDVRKLLGGKYGANPNKLLCIMNPETYFQTLTLAQVETAEKISGATIENGTLTKIYGMDVIVAPDFGLTEADGKASGTPANNTKGGFLVVYKPALHFGYKRRMKLSVKYLDEYDQYRITAHSRVAFVPARADMIALGYNATV